MIHLVFNLSAMDLDIHRSTFAIQLFVDGQEDYVGLLLSP